ncbi:MAG: hypothetical protein G01um101429_755 [Parcubacteria group bacterium Gr01-1014_29]|nr:MAG: hypothetical protein G01um101429_755 [Parcubacteria group bacterium Gr01-1014_29]
MEYDMHLAATKISQKSIHALEHLGFQRDEFANNTRCLASEYHGTYRGTRELPDDTLWEKTCKILLSDKTFSGCVEEEAITDEISIEGTNITMPAPVSPLRIEDVPTGKHKACDIHMRIDLSASLPEAIEQLERLEIASFDKPTPEGIQRVYTVTCETREDGECLFIALSRYLRSLPRLRGNMKLEITTRYLRYPDNAITLPITRHDAVTAWIHQ